MSMISFFLILILLDQLYSVLGDAKETFLGQLSLESLRDGRFLVLRPGCYTLFPLALGQILRRPFWSMSRGKRYWMASRVLIAARKPIYRLSFSDGFLVCILTNVSVFWLTTTYKYLRRGHAGLIRNLAQRTPALSDRSTDPSVHKFGLSALTFGRVIVMRARRLLRV